VDAPYELGDDAVDEMRKSPGGWMTKGMANGRENTAVEGLVKGPVYEVGGRCLGGTEGGLVYEAGLQPTNEWRQNSAYEVGGVVVHGAGGGVVHEVGEGAVYEMGVHDQIGGRRH
jgi:hypothetical protein